MQEGCPSHTISIKHEKHSSCVTIFVDGKRYTTFDRNMFEAILELGTSLEYKS